MDKNFELYFPIQLNFYFKEHFFFIASRKIFKKSKSCHSKLKYMSIRVSHQIYKTDENIFEIQNLQQTNSNLL
jgi:hypothetical protein